MSIKWEDIHILNSPLTNTICLGKVRPNTRGKGSIAYDRSGDVSKEVMAAVMSKLDEEARRDGISQITYSCEAGTLTWQRKEEPTT